MKAVCRGSAILFKSFEFVPESRPPMDSASGPEGPVRRFLNVICFVTKEDLVEESEVVTPEKLSEMDIRRATKFFQEAKTWKK